MNIHPQGELNVIHLDSLTDDEFAELAALHPGLQRTVPSEATAATRVAGNLVLAHSEIGHHHVIESPCAELFDIPDSPLIGYLRCESPVSLNHLRDHHTHGSQTLPAGTHFITRQREIGPRGWQRVAD